MSSPLAQPGARPALLLALALTTIGVMGVGKGWAQLGASPQAVHEPGAEVPEASVEAMERLVEVAVSSPIRKGLAAANLLVSALLVIASFMTTTRHRRAIGFVTQALYANLAWTLADAGGTILVLQQSATELIPLLEAHINAQLPIAEDGSAAESPFSGSQMLWMFAFITAGASLLMVPVYLLLLRTLGREDVQAFLKAR